MLLGIHKISVNSIFFLFIVSVTVILTTLSDSNLPLSVEAFVMVNLRGHARTFMRSGSASKSDLWKKRNFESTPATSTTSTTFAAVSVAAKSVFGTTSGERSSINGGGTMVPPDPMSLLDNHQLEEQSHRLASWFETAMAMSSRNNKAADGGGILCLTGAGLSTESGIPDYRGHDGSYHRGHKPMLHHHFMDSEYQRKRYWGRSMIGWKKFDGTKPNKGHQALARLERYGHLGVHMEDRQDFYDDIEKDEFLFTSGHRSLSIVTQNVDSLHQLAGSKDVIHLHGRGRELKCMNCGMKMDRNAFHEELEAINKDWLDDITQGLKTLDGDDDNRQRPDGDANLCADFNHVHVPDCPHCQVGFWKPHVVFFGDSVPKNRVALFQQAVQDCNGLLVVGTSLAVHSAFRHVRDAYQIGKPIAILNVGETRAEAEGLAGILKVEAPIGEILDRLVGMISSNDAENLPGEQTFTAT